MSFSNIKIGLLPLYLELYDKACKDSRPQMDSFYEQMASELERLGVSVLRSPLCRVKREFKAAVSSFEKAQADLLVTLHLAYSPSLESSDVLAETRLPIVVLDTTPSFAFGPETDASDIMYNHGIHGVQDMCNMLLRNGKFFKVEAGHWKESDVLSRVVAHARSAKAASAMRSARVGLIGRPFAGMGDFYVPPNVLKRTTGVTTVPCDMDRLRKITAAIKDVELDDEISANRRLFSTKGVDKGSLRLSSLAALAIRRWIKAEKLTAFTANFLAVNKASGIPTMPFMEASLGMARGIGYGGEGDVLTAALVSALLSVYPSTTFAEMFCPDWKSDTVFLSHMGEVNVDLIQGKPGLCAPPFPFTDVPTPVRPVGCLKAGKAVYVNLAPLINNKDKKIASPCYRLIVTPGRMIAPKGGDKMKEVVRGWFKPERCVGDFLAEYSRKGGTHHAALVYGEHAGEIAAFGDFMGWESVILR